MAWLGVFHCTRCGFHSRRQSKNHDKLKLEIARLDTRIANFKKMLREAVIDSVASDPNTHTVVIQELPIQTSVVRRERTSKKRKKGTAIRRANINKALRKLAVSTVRTGLVAKLQAQQKNLLVLRPDYDLKASCDCGTTIPKGMCNCPGCGSLVGSVTERMIAAAYDPDKKYVLGARSGTVALREFPLVKSKVEERKEKAKAKRAAEAVPETVGA